MTSDPVIICPVCEYTSGNDWSQCADKCPMPGSPWFDQECSDGLFNTIRCIPYESTLEPVVEENIE